jgi:hypothetical protein
MIVSLEELRAEIEARVSEEREAVAGFFDGAAPAVGVAALDVTGVPETERRCNVAMIVDDEEDPALRACFELRDRLDDQAFVRAWRLERPASFTALGHPEQPVALIRCQFTARAADQEIERAFLLDPTQIEARLLRRFCEQGVRVWLIPMSVAFRERERSGPGSAYDTLSPCLPLGICTSDTPLVSIEFALRHVGAVDATKR